jgi:hypothetical protein
MTDLDIRIMTSTRRYAASRHPAKQSCRCLALVFFILISLSWKSSSPRLAADASQSCSVPMTVCASPQQQREPSLTCLQARESRTPLYSTERETVSHESIKRQESPREEMGTHRSQNSENKKVPSTQCPVTPSQKRTTWERSMSPGQGRQGLPLQMMVQHASKLLRNGKSCETVTVTTKEREGCQTEAMRGSLLLRNGDKIQPESIKEEIQAPEVVGDLMMKSFTPSEREEDKPCMAQTAGVKVCVCMNVCMHVCICMVCQRGREASHVWRRLLTCRCVDVCMYVCMHKRWRNRSHVCMYVRDGGIEAMYVCMYACKRWRNRAMYVCMYVCKRWGNRSHVWCRQETCYTHIHTHTHTHTYVPLRPNTCIHTCILHAYIQETNIHTGAHTYRSTVWCRQETCLCMHVCIIRIYIHM